MLPLCGLLDSATVVRVVGAGAGTCQEFAKESEAGRCLWGQLGAGARSVQLTAFTGTLFTARRAGWRIAIPAVTGAGLGAWSTGPITIGSEKNVVLYVDYGTFGIEFAVSAPGATVQTALALAQSVK